MAMKISPHVQKIQKNEKIILGTFSKMFLKIGENCWFQKNRCINVLFSTCKKHMKEKYYGYENFTTHAELQCEYKNSKNRSWFWGRIFRNLEI